MQITEPTTPIYTLFHSVSLSVDFLPLLLFTDGNHDGNLDPLVLEDGVQGVEYPWHETS